MIDFLGEGKESFLFRKLKVKLVPSNSLLRRVIVVVEQLAVAGNSKLSRA